MVDLKNKIKKFRQELGFTQSDLAKTVGVRRETIVRIEKNLYNPSLILAEKIALACNKKIYDVFQFEDNDIKLD